ncbi:MAG: ABC transporter ATP-binding protein, partial [Longicatena sp.]
GQLVAFMDYLFHAMFSVMLFCTVFMQYPRAEVSAKRIQEVLDTEPLIMNPKNGKMEGDQSGTIEFDHVTFVYPDGEEPILHDISFKAKKGETIAFIGSTGSGKSTLVNLIPRFYDVTSGHIYIDGVDLRDYDLFALRSKLGVIPQKAMLFSGTIEENIRFGKEHATHEEVEHAAKTAQGLDFIMEKEKHFEEEITEGATNVSGGQKQRLSIARALVRKPDIYVFDDSFSALDFKTDAKLRHDLKKETKDSIVMVVAQRISSIMDADRIVVLDEGNVIGIGTHKELLKNCQIYHEIALSQLSEEELNHE